MSLVGHLASLGLEGGMGEDRHGRMSRSGTGNLGSWGENMLAKVF